MSALEGALAEFTGNPVPISREDEGTLYERILRERFEDAARIIDNAGHWESDRVSAG